MSAGDDRDLWAEPTPEERERIREGARKVLTDAGWPGELVDSRGGEIVILGWGGWNSGPCMD